MTHIRRGALLSLVATLIVVVAACSDGGDGSEGGSAASETTGATPPSAVEQPTTSVEAATATSTTTAAISTTTGPADPRASRPYEVRTKTFRFVDDSRPTVLSDGSVLSPSRTLETTVYYPITDEPVPLVMFSHGYSGDPSKFERLLGAWAEAGYAAAAPLFPLTNGLIDPATQKLSDVAEQPADISFVLDQLLSSPLADRFDTSRLGAAGLSLGGLTTYMVAVDESTRDDRFVAAVVMAGIPPGETFSPHEMPVLVMHGEMDPVLDIDTARNAVTALHSPAYLVTMLGGFHAEPFEDAEDNTIFEDPARFHPTVDATTIAFWDTYLLADPTAEPEIGEAADVPGIATFEPHEKG